MLRGNRFRLVTLGRLTLLGPTGEEDASLAKRRAKLALLAVLAMARRPVARDVLLEMFWGDQEESRARHSLSNALSSLRGVLGPRAITTRDADVALLGETPLDVDAFVFADAIERRDFAEAIEAYAGHFLAGVHVDGSPAFDQWVTRERRRLESLYVQACTAQCTMLARARRWPECADVAAKWLEVEPLSSDAALYLFNAIKAPGTRASLAAALAEYDRHVALVAREYDLAPDRAVAELASRIREQLAAAGAPPDMPAPEEPASRVVADPDPAPPRPEAAPAASAEPVVDAATAPSLARPASRVAGMRRLPWIAAAVVLGGAIGFGAWSIASRRAARATPAVPVIALLGMDLRTADSSITWLADGLPSLIAGKLAHNADVEIVAPTRATALMARSGHLGRGPLDDATVRDLARRLGASLVASGVLGGDDREIVLDLTVREVATGRLVRNDVLTRSDPLALADEAAVRILGAANVRSPGPRLSDLETTSLDAYQRYMRALEFGQAGRLTEHVHELDAAIALDSGFIAALRSRLFAAIALNDTALVEVLRGVIRRQASRASAFDRMEQDVHDAYFAGERERSEALARGIARRYPRDPRAYQLLQMVLGAHGRFEEAERVAEQGIALDSLAIEAGTGPCAQCVGFYNIVFLHWVRHDFEGAAAWARRWIRAQPDGASAWASLAWTYSYQQRPDSALPLIQRAISLSGGELWGQTQYVRMLLVARRYAAADSAIAAFETSPVPDRREAAADLRVMLDREHGRIRAAMGRLDSLERVSPHGLGFLELMRADDLRILGRNKEAAARFERMAHAPGEVHETLPVPTLSARGFCWHHALAADALAPLGDTLALRFLADTLERGCAHSFYGRDWRLYHHVRGLIAVRAGRYEEAEREFAAAVWTTVEGWGRTTVELADAQVAGGRFDEAIGTLRTAYATRLDAMGRYVPISELDYRMARVFAAAGTTDSARRYAAFARTAWRDADPEIRRLLDALP